ncbi:hypothetical protein MU582_03285 [Nocardioidaceae bacterium SCSIO 66511]|nr:hypothetical protein MU582_03285 [Nocardioidaceae bacterium SCSIO 66511]
MRRLLVCVLVAFALMVGGCSGGGSDDHADKKALDKNLSKRIDAVDEPTEWSQEDDATTERDPKATSAALWRLDPCRLVAPKKGKPGRVEQSAPHRCQLSIGATEIRFVLGAILTTSERKQIGATNVRGAKAYIQRGSRRLGGCTGWLPVSRDNTIRVEDEFAECWRVRPILRRVVDRIDAPSSTRTVPGLGAVETCPLLEHGLGSAIKGRKVEYGADNRDYGLDHCAALDSGQQDTAHSTIYEQFASLELDAYQAQTLTFEEGVSDTPTPDAYASSGWPADFGTIRGRSVFGSRGDGGDYECIMRWAESTTILQLEARTCARAKPLVRRMIKFLDNRPQPSASPQKPLLYDAGDDDFEARGGCADYLPLWFGPEYGGTMPSLDGPACHPFTESDVPDDPAEIVVAAQADPNVTCDLATDAVRDEFGDRLEPATLEVGGYSPVGPLHDETVPPPLRVRPCVFVDPRRKVQVQVFVSSDPMAVSRYQAKQLEKNDTPTRAPIGPGIYGIGNGDMVGLGETADDAGFVAVFAGKRPKEPEVLSFLPVDGIPQSLERVTDAIIRDHLAE